MKKGHPEKTLVDIDNSVLFRMIRIVNFFGNDYEATVSDELNISRREYHILLVIALHPGVSAIKVSDYSGYSQMAVSRGVKNLLKLNRINKMPDKLDKRKFELSLTDAGWEIYQELSPISTRIENDALSCLSNKQIKSLKEILSILSLQMPDKLMKYK